MLVLCGLVASGALLVDTLRTRPVFCAEGGGCDAVQHSAFAAPLGVPLPLVGTLGFLAIGAAALVSGRRARLVQLVLSVERCGSGRDRPDRRAGEARRALPVLLRGRRERDPRRARGRRAHGDRPGRYERGPASSTLSSGALALGLVTPPLLAFGMSSVPATIRDEMARSPKGDVTVVDFVDFECPYCRMTNAELAPVVEAHKDRVRLVRVQVPLHSHPHALDAARAACCGERLGKGDAMAEALFSTPVERLTSEGCEAAAERIGIPVADYRACVADPSTAASIESDRARFRAAGGRGLPTIWIGDRELVGAQSRATLSEALEAALARAGS